MPLTARAGPEFFPAGDSKEKDDRHWHFSADDILGQPQVRITDGKIRIDRHVHGFYHEWTWKNDSRDFADTSNL